MNSFCGFRPPQAIARLRHTFFGFIFFVGLFGFFWQTATYGQTNPTSAFPGLPPAAATQEESKPLAQEPDPGVNTTPPAADPLLTPSTLTVTQEEIRAQREAVAASGMDEESKKRASDMYQVAADRLARLDQINQRVAELQQLIASAPARAEQLRGEMANAVESVQFELEKMSLADLQKEAAAVEQRLREWKERVSKLNREQEVRVNRKREIQSLILSHPERLADIKTQLQAQPPEGEAPAVTKARRTELQTQQRLLEAELPVLNLERDWIEVEAANEINRLERDRLNTQIAEATAWLPQVQEELNRQLKKVAADAAAAAQSEIENVPPQLRDIAEENTLLAEEFVEITDKISGIQADRDDAKSKSESLKTVFDSTKKKVKEVGLTEAIGFLLRKQRVEVPSVQSLEQYKPAAAEIDSVQLRGLELDDASSAITSGGDFAAKAFPELAGLNQNDISNSDQAKLRLARDLQAKKKEKIDNLKNAYDRYFQMLVDMDTDQRRLANLISEYRSFIDERILWIPSSKPMLQQISMWESEYWFWKPETWIKVAAKLSKDAWDQWVVWLSFLIVFVGLQYKATEYRKLISKAGREASSGSCITFLPTARSLIYTLLISLPWSIFLFFLGWRLGVEPLSGAAEGGGSSSAVAAGMIVTGFALLPLECLRHICREMGLGAAHFGWSSATLAPINRLIRMLATFGLPLVFFTTAMYWMDPVFRNDLLERLCFVLQAALLTYVVYRLLAPNTGLLKNYYASNAGGWLDRLQYVWFTLALIAPIFLAILAVVGYYYTACQLSVRLYAMFWLIICLLIGRELTARLILVRRRKVYIAQARQRRTQPTVSPAAEESEIAVAALISTNKEWVESLSAQTKQSQNLLNSVVLMIAVFGTWFIWADVIPALRVVYKQTLWTTTEVVAVNADDGVLSDQVTTTEVIRTITPTDLFQSIVVLAMTFVVFRNLPGLIDILILNRLPLDASTRNAITAVSSYLVIVLGVIWSAKAIGVHWTQVQWLVTALTFGLAFGLQEIFANFVAGVIILFERPIRVGDVVTVDGVTGIVTRTRARATTIRNWDLQELIVPNKEFITNRVLNWTLTDQVTRLVVPVGVAYGSETKEVLESLLMVAKDNPLVLDEPAPLATFEQFGDSTLNFVLRAYVSKLDDRLKVISELHQKIDEQFRLKGIEIAFPQRDLNIKMLPPSWQVPPPSRQALPPS